MKSSALWSDHPEDLIAFETEIADIFNAGKIRAPVHLYSGNEAQMIEDFPRREAGRLGFLLLAQSLSMPAQGRAARGSEGGNSRRPFHFTLFSRNTGSFRRPSSPAVLPIAVGTAMGIKRRGEKARVHCFVGDMTAETGSFHECLKYSDEPSAADPLHRRGQRQIRLHRHARNVEPAGADLRKQPPSAGGLLQVSNQISARRRRPAGPILT
jgi:hypothetical protein